MTVDENQARYPDIDPLGGFVPTRRTIFLLSSYPPFRQDPTATETGLVRGPVVRQKSQSAEPKRPPEHTHSKLPSKRGVHGFCLQTCFLPLGSVREKSQKEDAVDDACFYRDVGGTTAGRSSWKDRGPDPRDGERPRGGKEGERRTP